MADPAIPPGAGPYRRIVLKLSGESFAHTGERGIAMEEVVAIGTQICKAAQRGVQIAIVIGGGNILRGAQFRAGNSRIQEATAHYMGMLATVINGLALSDSLERFGVQTRVMSAIDVHKVCEPFIRRRAVRHLEKGRVLVLVGGLGSPYFTTDSAAAQRGVELACDVLLKATMVDGVYDKDPRKHKDAVRIPEISFQEVLERRLKVMDQTAFALCQEQNLPVVVFDMDAPDGLLRAARGEKIGTIVRNPA